MTILLIGVLALAQTISGYTLRIYLVGATSPLLTYSIAPSQVVCGQPAVSTPTSTVINPKVIVWDDPANVSLTCRWSYSGSGNGPLYAVPVGSVYELTLTAVSTSGSGPESARSNPFAHAIAIGALTGVKVIP